MRFFGALFAVLLGTSAQGQETAQGQAMAGVPSVMDRATVWEKVGTDFDTSTLMTILSATGHEQLPAGADTNNKWDVYSFSPSPGTSTIFVTPSDTEAPGTLYTAGVVDKVVSYVMPSKEEIVAQLEAALEAFCGMSARPTEIRATASALGVLAVEGTWNTAEVCK